ncbi:glycerophosphodiester phosphodiesterase [Pygmaiobacter massiliensis]|uniref:glycerophosphodiester phosphodiesterase n=1 Tax=Pygmaiobacter massiliensis TaxID=1917873 RepID=UPI00241F7F99|nr:glycerophosphodiester phosphodiesterase [Pygmaiobacter massiliensis]
MPPVIFLKDGVTLTFFVLAVLLILLILFFIYPCRPSQEKSRPFYGRNYAHRGLHTKDKSVPENSLAAFRAAVEHGYGIELDIQLSKDGEVVVFHDDTLDRVCGVHGRVDAYTLEELRSFSLCGTEQRIPLLTEVFEVMDGKAPMIIELKSGPRNTELCEKGYALMQQYHGAYCIESFDPRIVCWFKKHAPQVLRGQLAGRPETYNTLPSVGGFVLGNLLGNVLARPEFVAYDNAKKPWTVRLCDRLGALRVLWTARDEADKARVESENDLVIFEFYLPEVQFRTEA